MTHWITLTRLSIVSLGVAMFAFACGSGDDNASAVPVADAAAGDATKMGSPDAAPARDGEAGADAGTVTFSVDVTKGPARQFQPTAGPQRVSSFIYGINAGLTGTSGSAELVATPTRWGLERQGGDSFTSWNWVNNYNNAGSDFCFYQGTGNGGTAPAGAITSRGDSIQAAQAKGEAFMATVPVIDFVAAPWTNAPSCPVSGVSDCNGGTTSSVRVNPGNVPFEQLDAGSDAFVANLSTKPDGGYCTCAPGGSCDGGCAIAASPVYQDEFVNYVRRGYGSGGAPIFFDLDNEPNYWGGTHPDLWPFAGSLPCQTWTVTYDDIVRRNVQFATAIKAAWPEAKVFGPVVAQDGMIYAHDYATTHWPTEFLDYYLAQMASASASSGRPLLDVLDVHYYTNSGSPSAAQCVQSPRFFWDPNYTSLLAAKTAQLDFGWAGPNGYFNTAWYPRKLIPRLLAKIANAYPSGAPGLSISEYNNGCEGAIAGGVAQADVLGIFGREGVFAAAAWPLRRTVDNYLVAAFDLYRNYDGHGAVVGDTAVLATTSDPVATSIYALSHSDDPLALDLVAINKTASSVVANMTIAGVSAFSQAAAFALVDGAAAVSPALAATPTACSAVSCQLTYVLPPMSATTIAVRPSTPTREYVKVDDMEVGTNGPIALQPSAVGEVPGGWFDFVSAGSPLNTASPSPFAYATLPAPQTTWPGVTSTRAAHVACSVNDAFGTCQEGLVFALAGSGTARAAVTVDVGDYDGITFWGRSDASNTVQVSFPDIDTDARGGRCGQSDGAADRCWDEFGKGLVFTPTWQQFTVSFRELRQNGYPFVWGYGPPSGAFDAAHVYGITFGVAGPTTGDAGPQSADFWIDDVYLTRLSP